jgi:hypothetical protein
MKPQWRSFAVIATVIVTVGCTTTAAMHGIEGYGPKPTLPQPDTSWIPTINVVKAVGWSEGERPVAETNAPPRPDDGKGIKGWFFKRYQTPGWLALDSRGGLLVADDVGNVVWRVSGASAMTRR